MKLVEEITQIEQNLKQTVEKNKFKYGTTISMNYSVNHKFPYQTMKVGLHKPPTLTIQNELDIKKGILQ